jgi:hypothetical protein
MRYYKVLITDKNGKLFRSYNSQDSNGHPIMTALNIEIDLPVTQYSVAEGAGSLRIWGIPIDDIKQSTQMRGMSIQIFGGMQQGLPLANPQQAGLLLQGTIQQCFANWIGTSQTLDFVIMTPTGTISQKNNYVLNWKKGTPLHDAILQTLNVAVPGSSVDITISKKLILNHDEFHYCGTLTELAKYIKQLSIAIIGGAYTGVDISMSQGNIYVDDGTGSNANSSKQIEFIDCIGQPTWAPSPSVSGATVIQVTCVMRGDIRVNDYVTLPKSQITTLPGAQSQFYQIDFNGQFSVTSMRHVGNFRHPDAQAWISTFDCSIRTPNG